MLNCDLLLCSEISQAIKNLTNSIYSHVGIIVKFSVNGEAIPFVIEAINPRSAAIPLTRYYKNYQDSGKPYAGQLYLATLKDGLTVGKAKAITTKAIDLIDVSYDNASIIQQAFNNVFGLNLTDKDHHRLICSELVAKAYEAAQIYLRKDKHGYITPASIGSDYEV